MVDFVRGMEHTPQASITRANNTTQYAAGQTIGASYLTFTGAARDQGAQPAGGIIAEVVCVDLANQTTKPDLLLYLFDTAPGATITDNGAFVPTNADMQALVAVISIPSSSFRVGNAGSGAAGNCACDVQGLTIPFNTKKADANLYGVLVANNAYTPVAQETFQIRLKVLD